MDREEILKRMQELHALAETETRAFSDEEQNEWDGLEVQLTALDDAEKRGRFLSQQPTPQTQQASAAEATQRSRAGGLAGAAPVENGGGSKQERSDVSFHLATSQSRVFRGAEGAERAVRFAKWAYGAIGHLPSQRWCADAGVDTRAFSSQNNVEGGSIIPNEFMVDLKRKIEEYSVVRQKARIHPMATESRTIARPVGRINVYPVGEKEAFKRSDTKWEVSTLSIKKWGGIAIVPNDLSEDAAVSVADGIVADFAPAFAEQEESCVFMGDGSSAYHGLTGLMTALKPTFKGVVSASAGSAMDWTKITYGDFLKVIGSVPKVFRKSALSWYVSNQFWVQVMLGIAYGAPGTASETYIDGIPRRTFFGYPVETIEDLPSAAQGVTKPCFFGDLYWSVDFGDRGVFDIAKSTEATVDGVSLFETDQMAIRGRSRTTSVLHNLGDDNEAGAMLALQTQE